MDAATLSVDLSGLVSGKVAPCAPKKGALIALIGCDGSGKSSLSADLVKTLRRTNLATYVYLGLGSGDIGRKIGQLPLVGPVLEKVLTSKAKKTRTKGEKIPGVMTALVVFGFSLLRFRRFQHMMRARRDGVIVITDRYPQAEIAGQCDGPGLSAARAGNAFVAWLARAEYRLYQRMAQTTPDLVIRLDVDAETAHSRKPDHDIEALRTKIALTPRLKFNGAALRTVDARQSYENVRSQTMGLVCDVMRKKA
ncbi:nucleoside/nucleotide kinase family protein [Gluconobacter wancherniae]|uniref:hypothetical protein n=1 Tax=Gluconobacter wancherniae TaxID=1307955 RepID=UPI001B8C3CAA|nr:hypothetical protein [Gluconobacter wancherniae]MBS1093125.1 hypothetical protein [Gluconobacter wancherniae]